MVKSQLRVFARLKPSQTESIVPYHISPNQRVLEMQFARNSRAYQNSEHSQFQFEKVLRLDCKQSEVFESVAKPVVISCLKGYNGTIFAYGQTGSGKTYTMSGIGKSECRGIIPRVLGLIFKEFENHKAVIEYRAFVSYIQIYNECAYDLLDRKKDLEKEGIEHWKRIQLYEDEEGNFNLRNMSVYEVRSEYEGIELMMTGNYIRQVSSTPMNQCSSRSHCVFTINIEGRELNSDLQFHSKLHLVDLAGSERISKTQVDGTLLSEAKHINLSLSYLEQVIVALNDRKRNQRTHIPYRNSLMTTILRDSLGGNCQTVMIATVSLEQENIEETISTLRFSQRVGLLENEVEKNHRVAPAKSIDVLTRENEMLKARLQRQEELLHEYSRKDSSSSIKTKSSSKVQNEETILREAEDWLNEAKPELEISSLPESLAYLQAVKRLYNDKIREFLQQLQKIGHGLLRYDSEIKNSKANEKNKENMSKSVLLNEFKQSR